MGELRTDYDHSKLEGVDVDIEISLKDYGIAWIETDNEFLFYYGIKQKGEEWTTFDFCGLDKNMDVKKEYDWVEWEAFESFIGCSITDESFPNLIHSLVQYYGYENIFGSTYWEGLSYEQIIGSDEV